MFCTLSLCAVNTESELAWNFVRYKGHEFDLFDLDQSTPFLGYLLACLSLFFSKTNLLRDVTTL